MVDFHSHVLPGIDDGSSSVEMSAAMLKLAAEQGTQTMVATPHFYADRNTPAQFLARRQEAVERLQSALQGVVGLPRILLGAEVAYFRGMSDAEALWDLRIADTNYILVEPPLLPWDDRVYEELSGLLTKQNLRPIIAHIDRYLHPLHRRRVLDRLQELPVLLQANASFFSRKLTEKLAIKMLGEGRIHLLGTDCHNRSDRPPNMEDAIEKIEDSLGIEALDHISWHEQLVLQEEFSNHCTVGANI